MHLMFVIVSWKLYDLFFIFYAHCNILLATLSLSFLIIFYINVWQTEQLLNKSYHRLSFSSILNIYRQLKRFQKYNTHNLKLISISGIYSTGIIMYLLIFIPINCYLVIFIMLNETTAFNKFTIASLIIPQMICLFGFHLVFAICNRFFQKSSTEFIQLLPKLSRKNLSLFIKLSNYGQAFHTRNKYGFTYGKLELISIREFMMVS